MKRIYTHDNVVVLHSIKNVLALNNIESFVKNEHTAPVGAQHGINNIFHELWLNNDEDFDRAAVIIDKKIDNPPFKAAWVCSHCHEQNDGSFEICWQCQSPSPA